MARRVGAACVTSGASFWTADQFTLGCPIMVLAPHADDESLGCGGLLAASFASVGAHVVCVTDGRRSHPNSQTWPGARLAACRERELRAAVIELGGSPGDVTFLRYHDCEAPRDEAKRARATAMIAGLCEALGIRTLFAPSSDDLHDDHRAVSALAGLICTSDQRLRLFHYSIWARWRLRDRGSGAHCERWFATAAWRSKKRSAIQAHRSQLGQVVNDDAAGFTMSTDFVDFFVDSDERFLEVRA